MRLARQNRSQGPSDADLVDAIRRGDASSLGLLLERHRPHLYARAFRLLGYHADAEDAVQETCLIAMRHVGAIRDAKAVGAWLHAVLHRSCLQHRRRRRGELLTDTLPEVADRGADPEERLERLELRDWIHVALDQLPEPLRVTALLRYFGSYDSYDEVAATLGIPIGTVRSRLAEAKVKLADALLGSAGLVHDEARARTRGRERFWAESLQGVFRRGESHGFVAHFSDDLLLAWSSGKRTLGRRHLAAELEGDIAAGVRLDVQRVMGSDGIVVVEGRFVNPPDNPDHCPPGIVLVLGGGADRPSTIHVHLSARRPRPEEE